MVLLFALGCVNPTPSETPSAEDSAVEVSEVPDWAALLKGAWNGTETSTSMGTQRGEYVVASADGDRFDVSYAPNGEAEPYDGRIDLEDGPVVGRGFCSRNFDERTRRREVRHRRHARAGRRHGDCNDGGLNTQVREDRNLRRLP